MRKLTEKDSQWNWFPAHAQALARVKEMIMSAAVLAYYDETFSAMHLKVDCARPFKKGAL